MRILFDQGAVARFSASSRNCYLQALTLRPVHKKTLRQRALQCLARREYSRLELAQRLGGERESAELTVLLDEFEERGWLSNTRYASSVARAKQGRYSQRYISEQLKAKGVTATEVSEAVAQLDQDDATVLFSLWQAKFAGPPTNEKEKARQIRFLQSRGFSLSAILKLLRQQAQ